MRIRRATEGDEPLLRELWEEFENEIPAPYGWSETWEEEWVDTARRIREGVVAIAEDDGAALGYAGANPPDEHGRVHVLSAYVRPGARRRGVTKALLQEVTTAAREAGATFVTLDVLETNATARAVWERLGFVPVQRMMATPLDELERRLSVERHGDSDGAVYVQTDDAGAVERAAAQFLPRVGASGGAHVAAQANGWTAVRHEAVSRDPSLLRRLARELSDRMGAVVVSLGVEAGAVARLIVFERGRVADEYASVPEFFGPLPPGDVVALRANPTVLSRLTGADPAAIRAAAPQGSRPDELPPAPEIAERLAGVLGLAG